MKIMISFTRNKNKLFWTINISGWLILLVLTLLLLYSERLYDYKSVIGVTITYVVGFFVSVGLRYLYRRINYRNRSIFQTASIILAISVVVTHIWYFVDVGLSVAFYSFYGEGEALIPKSLLRVESSVLYFFPIFAAWSTLYFLTKLWQDWSIQKERAEQANLLAHKAQLQMLRYQLNPHFLFNSLNSIRALVEADKETAKQVITELSEFLRYSLISMNLYDVPLKDEIEAIRHYFAIQQIRYEERLAVSYNIQQEAEEFPVLSFLVYPVIENAVKYGMQTSSMPLRIELDAKVDDNKLIISVSNSGRWVEKHENQGRDKAGTGTGLENVKQRLENAFPNSYSFEIIKNEGSVTVRIEITRNNSEH
jgi:two-component system LytT family sensor kinase